MNQPPSAPADSSPLITRHSGYVRFLHWSMAVLYLVVIATGLALYWRKLLGWMLPFFGGKAPSIAIHFWGGLILMLVTVLLFAVWRNKARWSAADTNFVRHIGQHALRPDQPQPEGTGFFNGGQKLYFWSIIITGVIFVLTGIGWWYRREMPSTYIFCRRTHRFLGVLMSVVFLVHLYKATIGEPGTLRSMISGMVTPAWARSRRPGWFRDLRR